MSKTSLEASIAQAEFDGLIEQFKKFNERLRRRWLRDNNRPPKAHVLYELDARERERVDGVIHTWERYVTPIAERWWARRGWGIRWPERSSDPCGYYKLQTTPA